MPRSPNYLFASGFPTRIPYAFPNSSTSYSLLWSFLLHLVKNNNYKVPRSTIFSIFLFLYASYVPVLSSVTYYKTTSIYVYLCKIHSLSSKNVIRGCVQKFLTGSISANGIAVTRCRFIAILWVSLVSFAIVTLCVASQWVIPKVSVYFVMTQSGNFWIHPGK
jgi:hypothetical protein